MKLLVAMERLREEVTAAPEYSVAGKLFCYAVGGYGGVELHDGSVWGEDLDYVVVFRKRLSCGDSFERAVPH